MIASTWIFSPWEDRWMGVAVPLGYHGKSYWRRKKKNSQVQGGKMMAGSYCTFFLSILWREESCHSHTGWAVCGHGGSSGECPHHWTPETEPRSGYWRPRPHHGRLRSRPESGQNKMSTKTDTYVCTLFICGESLEGLSMSLFCSTACRGVVPSYAAALRSAP